MTDDITVVIVDDHPLFRRGLRALLTTVPGVEVVGEATNGLDGVRLAEDLQPRLLLMDLQMPGGDGLSAIRRLTVTCPGLNILVVTMSGDDDSVLAALRAGARGYALKDADDVEMTRAVLAVANGEAVLSPAVADRMLSALGSGTPPPEPFPQLSASERNVLRLMARGLGNDAIAARLHLSPKTVRNYVSHVFAKLGVTDRGQAIVRAIDEGL